MSFQFTHPGKGATPTISPSNDATRCFNSRTPGGVRPARHIQGWQPMAVSIHAPREGCDRPRYLLNTFLGEFQFTHPGRGATIEQTMHNFQHSRFNSRTPGGVRLTLIWDCSLSATFQFTHPGRGATDESTRARSDVGFQFTHPGRGATLVRVFSVPASVVSIHAPREGCDTLIKCTPYGTTCFNSRTPGGVRRPCEEEEAQRL